MVIVILGPTAVGKTKLSVELAKRLDGEIINADSTQIYQDLNIDKVLFLESDMYKNKWTSTSTSGLSQGMIDFIDYVNEDNEGDLYRLVVSYKDGTYASVRIKGGNI